MSRKPLVFPSAVPLDFDNPKDDKLNGLSDIMETHLGKATVYVAPRLGYLYGTHFIKFPWKIPRRLEDFKKCVVNVEALPDDIVSKTNFFSQQGETIYLRFLEGFPQFVEENKEKESPYFLAYGLPFCIFEKDLSDEDKKPNRDINYKGLPIYVLTNALTKSRPFDMNRYYAVRNDYYILKWLY